LHDKPQTLQTSSSCGRLTFRGMTGEWQVVTSDATKFCIHGHQVRRYVVGQARLGILSKIDVPSTSMSRYNKRLTLSPPIPLKLYTLPYWYNRPFFNFWHFGRSGAMSEIKNGGLDQYGAEPLEQHLDQLSWRWRG